MEVLIAEIKASTLHGPRAHIADAFQHSEGMVVMWNALPLRSELMPEISLHFSVIRDGNGSPIHNLRYILLRETGESIPVTLPALMDWQVARGAEPRTRTLDGALEAIRSVASSLSQDEKKEVNRLLKVVRRKLL